MKIIVTGSTGMLGRSLVSLGRKLGHEITGIARNNADIRLDLTDRDAVTSAIVRENPDAVINAAAMIEFAKCEADPDAAFAINAEAVLTLRNVCDQSGARLIHISTDQFFSGDGNKAHDEDSPVREINQYGSSKLAGEKNALAFPNSLVIRTNITGPRNGKPPLTFFEWCLDIIRNDGEAVLFDDYFSSTLSVRQLSRAIYELLDKQATGLLNVACREVSSKKDFVERLAQRMGRELTHARAGNAASMKMKRAESAGLDVARAEAVLGHHLPTLDEVAGDLAEMAADCS